MSLPGQAKETQCRTQLIGKVVAIFSEYVPEFENLPELDYNHLYQDIEKAIKEFQGIEKPCNIQLSQERAVIADKTYHVDIDRVGFDRQF